MRARLNTELGFGGGCKAGRGPRKARPPWVEQCGLWGCWQCVQSAKKAPQAQQAIHSPVLDGRSDCSRRRKGRKACIWLGMRSTA